MLSIPTSFTSVGYGRLRDTDFFVNVDGVVVAIFVPDFPVSFATVLAIVDTVLVFLDDEDDGNDEEREYQWRKDARGLIGGDRLH